MFSNHCAHDSRKFPTSSKLSFNFVPLLHSLPFAHLDSFFRENTLPKSNFCTHLKFRIQNFLEANADSKSDTKLIYWKRPILWLWPHFIAYLKWYFARKVCLSMSLFFCLVPFDPISQKSHRNRKFCYTKFSDMLQGWKKMRSDFRVPPVT